MEPAKPSTISHLGYIDALRGIAFLAVLAVHAGQYAAYTGYRLVPAGQYGVQLFFLVSALTLLRSLSLRSRAELRPTTNFYLRRFFRIAPLFWFGIVVNYLLEGSGPRQYAPNGLHAWQYISTFFLVQGWAPTSINSVVQGGWSVAVEVTFYAFLPFVWRRLTSFAAISTSIMISLLVNFILSFVVSRHLHHTMPASQYYLITEFLFFWFPAQLCVFLTGFILFRLISSEQVLAGCRSGRNSIVLILLTIYGFVSLRHNPGRLLLPNQLMYAFVWIPFVLALAGTNPPLFVNRFTRTVGKLSFSCYILHFGALKLIAWLLHRFRISLPHATPRFAVFYALGLGLTVIASAVTYRLIEQTGIKLGNSLIRSMENRLASKNGISVSALTS